MIYTIILHIFKFNCNPRVNTFRKILTENVMTSRKDTFEGSDIACVQKKTSRLLIVFFGSETLLLLKSNILFGKNMELK